MIISRITPVIDRKWHPSKKNPIFGSCDAKNKARIFFTSNSFISFILQLIFKDGILGVSFLHENSKYQTVLNLKQENKACSVCCRLTHFYVPLSHDGEATIVLNNIYLNEGSMICKQSRKEEVFRKLIVR